MEKCNNLIMQTLVPPYDPGHKVEYHVGEREGALESNESVNE